MVSEQVFQSVKDEKHDHVFDHFVLFGSLGNCLRVRNDDISEMQHLVRWLDELDIGRLAGIVLGERQHICCVILVPVVPVECTPFFGIDDPYRYFAIGLQRVANPACYLVTRKGSAVLGRSANGAKLQRQRQTFHHVVLTRLRGAS